MALTMLKIRVDIGIVPEEVVIGFGGVRRGGVALSKAGMEIPPKHQ